MYMSGSFKTNKVSIIIPCYNQVNYIRESIESALNQTYKNIEIVVVNDASTDNSASVIKEYADKYPNIIFLDEKENKGVIKSRNFAISKCSGNYILPLDCDDKIASTFVQKAVDILDNDVDIRIVYSKTMLFGEKNKEFKLDIFNPDTIIFGNCIPNTAMYRKQDFLKVGGYKDYMKEGLEDWDFWISILEIAENKEKCAYRMDENLFFYRYAFSNTRNDISLEKINELYVNIVVNHKALYSTRKKFYHHISKTLPSKFNKKKNIIKKLIILASFQFLIIIIILLIGFIR